MQSRILATLTVACALLACGCDPSGASSDDAGDVQRLSEEEREKQARRLMLAAFAKPREQKIPLYERVIGLFPDSPVAVEARFRLINVLLHPSIDREDDALSAVRVLAARHPLDARAAEAWWWIALRYREDEQRGPEIRSEWARFLHSTRERQPSDPAVRGVVWLYSAYAAYWDGDRDQAVALLDEAAGWDLPEKDAQAMILFRGGSLQRELGRKEQAKALLERALVLVDEGAKGVSAPAIQSELDALKGN